MRVKGIREGIEAQKVQIKTKEREEKFDSDDRQYLISFDKSIHL